MRRSYNIDRHGPEVKDLTTGMLRGERCPCDFLILNTTVDVSGTSTHQLEET